MKSAREEKSSVMEKRGLKTNNKTEKENETEEELKKGLNGKTEEKLKDKKPETPEKKQSENGKEKQTKKSNKLDKSNEKTPKKLKKTKKTKEKSDDESYRADEKDKVSTRASKQKQMKITDSLKLSAKSTNSNKVCLNRKDGLVIPLRLEGDLSVNTITTKAENPTNEEKPIEKINKRPKKIDFATLDVTELDYSPNQTHYFNFRDHAADKKTELSKVNVILAIYEMALNQSFYGLQAYSNKTISFWNVIKNQPFFGSFFSYFSAETIRKYWRELSWIKNTETVVTILNDKRKDIDNNDIKLLPLIKLLKEYINNNSTGFEELLLGLDKKKAKAVKEESKECTLESQLNRKRNRSPEKENEEDEIDPMEIYRILDDVDLEAKKEFSLDEKFDAIAEIIESFRKCFNDQYNNEFILEALKMNSMDIQKTYEFLQDPTQNKSKIRKFNSGLIFNEYEDNIILNLKNTKFYQNLVQEKGEWAVKEREEFLKNEI